MKFMVKMLMLAAMTFPCASFARQLKPEVKKAMQKGAMAEIRLKVVDDRGAPVTNAGVRAIMDMPSDEYSMFGKTDTNGEYVVQGKTNGNYIKFLVDKDGYYDSYKRITYIQMHAEHDVKDGKWQPFGEREEIILRKSDVHAARLVALDRIVDVVHTNVWLGFDMEKMDFVKPVGIGTSIDWEINVDWDGLPAWNSKRCSAEIRFPAALTGGYYSKNVTESRFPFPFFAITDAAYGERCIRIVDRNGDPHTTNIAFPKDESFVTRTRCLIDEKGAIKHANYGCIRRLEIGPSRRGVALLRLSYVFNPTPNDTNLEPKR